MHFFFPFETVVCSLMHLFLSVSYCLLLVHTTMHRNMTNSVVIYSVLSFQMMAGDGRSFILG